MTAGSVRARPHRLEAQKIIATLRRLEARVGERFPDSGLLGVVRATAQTGEATAARVAALSRAPILLRCGVAALLLAGFVGQGALFHFFHPSFDGLDGAGLVQALEAAVNLVLLIGGGVWFLLTLEARAKRESVHSALHELRSLAHVVDMHQLTKDPTVLLASAGAPTRAGNQRRMSQFELARYLDYCAELLSLIGKLAALYGERVRDGATLEAVTDLENLTTNLGRKIWQKIMILSQLDERGGAPP